MYTHAYSRIGGCWTVGTGDVKSGTFSPVSAHGSEQEAAERAAWLNGSPRDRQLTSVIESMRKEIDELRLRIDALENDEQNPYALESNEIERMRQRMR